MEFLSLLYALLAALIGFQPGDRVSPAAPSAMSAQVEASAFEHYAAADAVVAATVAGAFISSGIAAPARLVEQAAAGAAQPYRLARRFGVGHFAILRE